MYTKTALLSLAATGAQAFPWVASQPGVDTSLYKRQQAATGAGSEALCPVNPNHVPAAPISSAYPYNGAKNGLPSTGKGGILVPDPNDKAHAFVAPDPTKDVRGPCPGLNAAANHNFLSHDGIVTYNELVNAQQLVYNVGYDLAQLLAVLGLVTGDGDPITQKLSIGCDATGRTSVNRALTGSEPGLAGHDKFEADSSLTRNDYFTHNGDNFHYNGTLFGMMQDTCKGNFNRENIALYRKQRYDQSRAENANFYFGPFSLLLFGASSFLYELMPSGPNYVPDLPTISSFFGAQQQADGTWGFNNMEKIPAQWTTRLVPYSIPLVAQEIGAQYSLYPVSFGGNIGNGTFSNLNFDQIQDGKFPTPTAQGFTCFLYQLATERIPASANGLVTPTVQALAFAASKLNPVFANLGCPIPLTKREAAAEFEEMIARKVMDEGLVIE